VAVKEPVVVKPTEPVPESNWEFKAKLEEMALEADMLEVPLTIMSPFTVREPVMTGKY
jgi:hypothetical protein